MTPHPPHLATTAKATKFFPRRKGHPCGLTEGKTYKGGRTTKTFQGLCTRASCPRQANQHPSRESMSEINCPPEALQEYSTTKKKKLYRHLTMTKHGDGKKTNQWPYPKKGPLKLPGPRLKDMGPQTVQWVPCPIEKTRQCPE